MPNWTLTPMSQTQLIDALREQGLSPELPATQSTSAPASSGGHNRVITTEYEDLILNFLLAGGSIIVRADLQLDGLTPGQDYPALLAANSINIADTGARAAILYHSDTDTPSPQSGSDQNTSSAQANTPPNHAEKTHVVLRIEHEIPVGPGLTSFQLSAALDRALAGIDRTLDAMVVELEGYE